eukprot:3885030-Amphidinium_carterae.5
MTISGVFVNKHMVYGDPSPLHSTWQSVYIDDYCQLCLRDPELAALNLAPPMIDEDVILEKMH